MLFSHSQIDELSQLAAALTPVSDIAAIMGVEEDALRLELRTPGSEARAAYLKAKADTSLMLRRQEIEFAKVGSPLAVQLTRSYLQEMTADEDF